MNCKERFKTDVEQKRKRRIWDLVNVESRRKHSRRWNPNEGRWVESFNPLQHCFAFEGSSWKHPPTALPNFFTRFVSENCYFNGLSIQT